MLKSQSSLLRLFRAATILALIAVAARAQDPFEIQVYEYETVPKGMWNLETHINYVGKGTKSFEGPVAPTNNQFYRLPVRKKALIWRVRCHDRHRA